MMCDLYVHDGNKMNNETKTVSHYESEYRTTSHTSKTYRMNNNYVTLDVFFQFRQLHVQ